MGRIYPERSEGLYWFYLGGTMAELKKIYQESRFHTDEAIQL